MVLNNPATNGSVQNSVGLSHPVVNHVIALGFHHVKLDWPVGNENLVRV